MRLFSKLLVIIMVLVLGSINMQAQVAIGATTYTSLGAAFNAINAGTHTGAITITITGNTTESSAAVLNASGDGSCSYTSILIYPTGTYTISGNITNGLIQLNGSDYVTIDGRTNQSGSSRNLTISNSNTSGACIWLDSNTTTTTGKGASYNTIKYCNLVGGSNSTSTTYGIVLSAASGITTGAAGNDNNTFSYNNIGGVYYGIRLYGTATTTPGASWVQGNKVQYNTFGSTTDATKAPYYCIYNYYAWGTEISYNEFTMTTNQSYLYCNYTYYHAHTKFNYNYIHHMTSTQASPYLYINYMYYGNGNVNINNNTVEDIDWNYYIYLSYNYYPNQNAGFSHNLYIQNNTIQRVKTGGTGYLYGFYNYGASAQTGKAFFNNNTYKDIDLASYAYLCYIYYLNNSSITDNNFTNILQKATATSGYIYNLYLGYSDSTVVYNNKFKNYRAYYGIYGIYNYYTSYSTIKNNEIGNFSTTYSSSNYPVNGIMLYGTTTTGSRYGHGVTVFNNAIYNINNCNYSATSTTSTSNPYGIGIYNTSNHKIYFNSVNMAGAQGGSSSSPSFSSGLWVYATASTGLDIRNNVFSNTVSNTGAGSKHYAVFFPSGYTFSTINYNDYYANGTYNVLGFVGADKTTIADWRTSTTQDVNSISADPMFNASNILPPKFGSPLLSAATPITLVSADINNVSRSATTPSIGAYEVAGDFSGPEISYTPISSTSNNTTMTLSNVVMTDPSGINVTTSKPRLYYRLSTNANTYLDNTSSTNGWKYVEASNTSSPFSFTLDYSKLNGTVSGGSSIEYFIVAQDLATTPNVTGFKVSFASNPTSVELMSASFPVSNVYNYNILNALAGGTYTVSSTGNYSTLTDDNGLFHKLAFSELSGNVTILINNDLTESGKWPFPNFATLGGNNYTVTIVPGSASNKTISGSAVSPIIKIDGNRLVIDGRYNGSGKYLTFSNTSTTSNSAVFLLSNNNNLNITNITLRNLIINAGSATTSNIYGIYLGSTLGTSVNNLDNINIIDNTIRNAYYGVYFNGGTSCDNFNLLNNIVGESSAQIGFRFLHINGVNNALVKNNQFTYINQSSSFDAILIGANTTNSIFENNKISELKNASTNRCAAFALNASAAANITFRNNQIFNIINNGTGGNTYVVTGFYITTGGGYNIYHNTVNMTGNRDLVGSSMPSSISTCIYIASGVNNINLKNNILINTQTAATNGASSAQTCGIYNLSNAAAFNASNYNDFYINNGAAYAYTGYNNSSWLTALTDWQSSITLDGNSISYLPTFLSSTDLHVDNTSITATELSCPTMVETPNDFDDLPRFTPNTKMGVDDVAFTIGVKQDLIASPSNATYCVGDSIYVSFEPQIASYSDNIARTYDATFTTKWYKDGTELTDLANKIAFIVDPIQQSDSANYYATFTLSGQTKSTSVGLLKVETPMAYTLQPTANESVCSNSSSLLLNSAATGTILGYQWQKENPTGSGTWVNISGANNPTLSITVANAQAAIGNYRMQTYGPGNCGPATITTSVTNVQVTDPITSFTATSDIADLKNVCIGTTIHLTSTCNGTVYGVKWQYYKGGTWTDLKLSEFPTANTNTLEIKYSNPVQSGKYRALFNGSVACGSEATPGPEFDVVIWPLFTINEHPTTQLLCEGGDFTLRTIADGTIYGYKWYKDGVAITESSNAIGTTSPIITIKNSKFATSGLYTVQLDIEDCSGRRIVSSNPALVYVITKTKITQKPETQNVALTGLVVMEVQAHVEGAPKDYKATVQWYKGTNALVDNNRITGSKSSILAIDNIQSSDLGEDYWVVVKGLCSSDTARGFGIRQSTVNITDNPTNVTLCEGNDATYSIKATSNTTSITYQWFKGTVALLEGTKYTGVKTNKLVVNDVVKADEGTDYFCKVSVNPGAITASSSNASLVVDVKPTITTQPVANMSVQSTKEIKLTVAATGTAPLTYQWFKNSTAIAGATATDFVISSAATTDAGLYYCVVTNNCGNAQTTNSTVLVTFKDMTGITETNEYDLRIDPNPINSESRVYFNIRNSGEYKISLNDLFGREVALISNNHFAEGNHSLSYNFNNEISSGTYYLTISNGATRSSIKVLVVK